MVADGNDQRAAKEFVRKQGIRNVKFLKAVVISRAEQLIVVDALKEQEHRKKFGKELKGAKRLIGVHIERCEPIIKKMRNE